MVVRYPFLYDAAHLGHGADVVRALGLLALTFYAAHAAWHVTHGSAWDLLWACNVAMPLLAAGCFLHHGRLTASALMFLAYGTPMWLIDLATGASMIPTSPLVHVGGPIVGVLAVRRLGWPRYSWVFASGITALLLLLSRIITPSAPNVNLAFRVHDGWERYFPNHLLYVGVMWLGGTLAFFVVELGAMRLLHRTPAPHAT